MVLPPDSSWETYEDRMDRALGDLHGEGVREVVYGDIFLEDLKDYRDEVLAKHGLTGVYPLWRIPTRHLAREFMDLGYRAKVVCVHNGKLERCFLGREYDESFLRDLPADVDACGENGEFHTFTYDGPAFVRGLQVEVGEFKDFPEVTFVDLTEVAASRPWR